MGIKEPSYEEIVAKTPLSFKESLKVTLKNKTFMIFIGTSTMNWYVFGLLPLLMPIYITGALGKSKSGFTTILLLIGFLCSIIGVIFWSKVDGKVGSKRGILFQ
ncbi:MAG: MFS transporter [Candidatus Helarchaeota archaeon]